MSVDDAMERLQAGSLKSFVARRKELSKELRSAGDKVGARTITAVAKPSLSAWVLNQLVRRHEAVVRGALATLDRQRDLQLGALSGELDAEALADAKQAEKAAMSDVAARAAEVLEEDGHAASKTNLERVTKGLRAAALDPERRALLENGALVKDEARGGFEAVASQLDPAMLLAALSAKSDQPPKKKKKVDGMFARSARSDASRDAGEAAPVEAAPARAERAEVSKLERLATAKVAAAKARTQIEEQRALVVAGEERIVTLENELTAARAASRSARRKLGDLKHRLEQAEKRIRLLEE